MIRQAEIPQSRASSKTRALSSAYSLKGSTASPYESVSQAQLPKSHVRAQSGFLRRAPKLTQTQRLYSGKDGMSVVLREPKDQIYLNEKMPFIFSSEKMESLTQ